MALSARIGKRVRLAGSVLLQIAGHVWSFDELFETQPRQAASPLGYTGRMDEKPKQRWFQISLREALLLTTLAGTALGWWRAVHPPDVDETPEQMSDRLDVADFADGINSIRTGKAEEVTQDSPNGAIQVHWSVKKGSASPLSTSPENSR